MLSQRYLADNFLDKNLNDRFELYPDIENREFWDDLAVNWKEIYCPLADEVVDKDCPVLPAVRYMDFFRNGNRINFENLYFERRISLGRLTVAECLLNDGRYIDSIINLIWCICEESSWCLPAHDFEGMLSIKDALPDIENPIVDLFAAETGAILSAVYHLLKPALDKHSKNVCLRIIQEVKSRFIKPYAENDYFWWMGFITNGFGWWSCR